MKTEMRVVIADGDLETEKVVRILPVDIMMARKHAQDDFEQSCYATYNAAKRAGFAGSNFIAWMETVIELAPVEADPKE